MAAHAVFTGYLSFGLISVPVKLYAAARTDGISFNQVHKHDSGSICKIQQKLFCEACNTTVEHSSLSKGYEVGKGQFVIIEDTELANLKAQKSETIEVTEFVPLDQVDPILFDKSYYVVPQAAGRKAYELLFQTMANTQLAGFSKLVIRGNEYNVFIRTHKNGITAHTVFTETEVRSVPEYESYRGDITVNAAELNLAKTLLESMTQPSFDSSKLKSDYNEKVQALIATKTVSPDAVGTSKATTPINSDDLLAKLSASLKKAA